MGWMIERPIHQIKDLFLLVELHTCPTYESHVHSCVIGAQFVMAFISLKLQKQGKIGVSHLESELVVTLFQAGHCFFY